jgi:hypothetical protein
LKALWVVHEIDGNSSDWAQAAMIERRCAVAFNLDQSTAADMEQHTASAMTAAAYALEDDGIARSVIEFMLH